MGLEFHNNVIKQLCETWGTKLRHTTPYTPKSNGKAERTNYSVVLKLSKLVSEEHEWDELLDIVLFQQRIVPIDKLKCSAFELLYGRGPNINHDKENNPTKFPMSCDDYLKEREMNFMKSLKSIQKSNEKYVDAINRRNINKQPKDDLDVDDLVVCLNRNKEDKLDKHWIGPYIVTRKLPKGVYWVKSLETGVSLKITREDLKRFYEEDDVTTVLNEVKEKEKILKGGLVRHLM